MTTPMSRNDEFRLYHGTIHDMQGDTLVPAKHFGATTPGNDPNKPFGQSRRDFVSATDSEDRAWTWAFTASGQHIGDIKPRERVHVVEPNPETKIGVEHIDHPVLKQAFAEDWYRKPQPAGEYVAPSFKVRETLDIMPGRQGTFPTINWNQFGKRSAFGHNHPNDPAPERRGRQMRLGRELAAAENEKIAQGQGRLF